MYYIIIIIIIIIRLSGIQIQINICTSQTVGLDQTGHQFANSDSGSAQLVTLNVFSTSLSST